MADLTSAFKLAKNWVAKNYGNNPGKLLLHTGVIGWVLSSAAQIFAIAINDEIPKEQKLFLIPQEFADACVNIVSFYFVTSTFKSVASKLVNQGKWVPKKVADFLNRNFAGQIGKASFDVTRDANLPKTLQKSFDGWANGIDFSATTVGTVISCNVITPLLRNLYASKRQKHEVAKLNVEYQSKNPYFKPNMTNFSNRTAVHPYNNGAGLKI